ncbi:MAG: hypothetical protein WEA82_08835 [Idiomarina sp.]
MTSSCVLYANDVNSSVNFYQTQLGFSVQSSNDDCAHLQLDDRHLTICQKSSAPAVSQASKNCCMTLSQRQLQQLLNRPELLQRPFLAMRGNSAEMLPLVLRDPAGNRLATCFAQRTRAVEQAAAEHLPALTSKRAWWQQLTRVFSELAEFNGYRR